MDLNILNDGQVESKPWLNPVCNVLSCNVLNVGNISTPLTRKMCICRAPASSLGIPAGTSTSVACNINKLPPSTSVNLLLNTFTCPNDGIINANLIALISAPLFVNDFQYNFTLNGVDYINGADMFVTAGNSSTSLVLPLTDIIPVTAGDVIGYRLINSSAITLTCDRIIFSIQYCL